jgi:hypothetical protein
MKRLLLCLLTMAIPAAATAGSLYPGHVEVGGVGSGIARVGQLGDDGTAFYLGAQGALLLNHHMLVGAELSVLMNDLKYTTNAGEDRFLELTNATLSLGYTFWPEAVVHPLLSVDGGFGWLRLRNPDKTVDEEDPDADTVFLARPTVHGVVNLTRTSRLVLGVGYTWMFDVDTEDFRDKDGEGVFGQIAVSFGAF